MEKTVPQRGSEVRERTRRLPPCFLYELAGDPQAQTGAGVFFRGEEWFEDVFEMLRRNAKAGICDGDANAGA